MPRLGTALPVVTYGLGKLPRQVPLPEAGQWVKLRNVAACIVNGQLQVRFLSTSMLPMLQNSLCCMCSPQMRSFSYINGILILTLNMR